MIESFSAAAPKPEAPKHATRSVQARFLRGSELIMYEGAERRITSCTSESTDQVRLKLDNKDVVLCDIDDNIEVVED